MPRIRPALDLIMKQSTTDLGLGSRPLLELIENFRTWDATEPVDKVYSLLAFSSDASTVPELQPDYAIPQSVLARRLVNFAFPDSLISPQSTNHDEVEFEIEGLLLGKTSSMTWNGETFWNFQAGESVVPNVIFNPVVLELFKDKWDIRIASGRRLQDDSAVVLLRGASRPTVLRFHEGQYIVDMLATTEPLKGGSELAFKHLLSTPPEYKDMGWSEALKALSAESEGFMKFKLSWDPFRQLDPSEYSRYTPTPNSMRTQWDARLESLKDAAENGSKDYLDCAFLANLVAVLYCEGKKLKAGTSEYTMTIHKAAYNGYHGTVKLLLDSNVEVDSRDSEHNMTGLHLAAKQGHPKVVRALLDAKATVDSLDGFNKTPLDHAVLEGNSEICQMLLDAGADPNPLGRICNPLLFDAVNKDYVVIVTKLLKAGADVNTVIDLGPVAGPTLLHVAAEMGRKALVTVLLEAGAQVNPRIMTGATPLHQAAVYGHTEVVKLLLNAGADVDAQEHDGMTPLDNSLYCGQLETAQAILQAGGRQSATAPNIDEWEDVDEEGANTAEGVGEEEDVDEEQYLHEEENVDEKQGICENGATSEKEDMNEEKILMERLILTMKKVSIESKKSIRRKMLTSSRIST